jgi:hypothetical protein
MDDARPAGDLVRNAAMRLYHHKIYVSVDLLDVGKHARADPTRIAVLEQDDRPLVGFFDKRFELFDGFKIN